MNGQQALIEALSMDYAFFGEPVTYTEYGIDFVDSWSTAKEFHIINKYGENALLEAKRIAKKVKKNKAAKRKLLKKVKEAAAKKRKVAKRKAAAKPKSTKRGIKKMAESLIYESAYPAREAAELAYNIALSEYICESYETGFLTTDFLNLIISETV